MNLYVISDSPDECVKALDDFLLRRTIIESAQMLSTAVWLNDGIKVKPDGIYKVYVPNEEHNIWIRESKLNFKWTFLYLLAAINEFSRRTGKEHKCWKVCQAVGMLDVYFPDVPMTPFPRTFNKELPEYNEVAEISDTFRAYKSYLKYRWKQFENEGNKPVWTNATKPDWA